LWLTVETGTEQDKDGGEILQANATGVGEAAKRNQAGMLGLGEAERRLYGRIRRRTPEGAHG
jgi:hypothetical protein